jgi:hypothetical protein
MPRIEDIATCIHTGDLSHGRYPDLPNAFRVYAVIPYVTVIVEVNFRNVVQSPISISSIPHIVDSAQHNIGIRNHPLSLSNLFRCLSILHYIALYDYVNVNTVKRGGGAR